MSSSSVQTSVSICMAIRDLAEMSALPDLEGRP
jgi:hypothetical protein